MLYSPFAKKISLNPPFKKGEFTQRGAFPLFEKEGQGEILYKCEFISSSAGLHYHVRQTREIE